MTGEQDLAYLSIELSDDEGIVDFSTREVISMSTEGPATLAGLGTGAASTKETFVASEHSTYRGRPLAVIRSGDTAGKVVVTTTSRDHGSAVMSLEVV
jgi:beta-galactosidase